MKNNKNSNNGILVRKQRKVIEMSTTATLKIKPIKATPSVSGIYAKEVVLEAFAKPSEDSIKRNQDASNLLKKLRG